MEAISGGTKYFLTPSNNIVSGVPRDGKIHEAKMYTKKDKYTTPTELHKLQVERNGLGAGKVPLTEIQRPNFADYNIPLDAGKVYKKRGNKVRGGAVTATQTTTPSVELPLDIVAGKKKRGSSVKSSASKKSSKSKKSKKSSSHRATVVGGAVNDEKKTTLADLFKQVSLNLAQQTSDLIARGGNPSELIKTDIKFFSKS